MSLASSLFANRGRKIVLAAVSAATIGAGLGAPTAANAFPLIPCWKLGTCKPYPGYGYGAAALAGGFALGALAASAASANSGSVGACWYERRKAVDDFGNLYIRKIRVCE